MVVASLDDLRIGVMVIFILRVREAGQVREKHHKKKPTICSSTKPEIKSLSRVGQFSSD